MTLMDVQAKSSDNSLEPGPLYWELASSAARVPGPRQLVPEPSKWVGGGGGAVEEDYMTRLDLNELQILRS